MVKRILPILMIAMLSLAAVGCDGSVDDVAGVTDVAEVTSTTAEVDPGSLLTPDDVESVSRLSGLKIVPYAPEIGAGGDVNIADASGQLVVMLVVEGPETWDAWLTDGYTVAESVSPPVGDESFIGPNPDTAASLYIFGFRKGDVAVTLDTYFDANGETVLSTEQLRELAEVIESRL